jgi:5'-nucleotidase
MFKSPLKLKNSCILISNDDGINAPGIKKLEDIAKTLARDVWVVAPETEQSGTGHSLTLRSPLRIKKIYKNHYSVNGTPTDCVLLAINKIMSGNRPDLVLSGINNGLNVGEDMTYSGTIAAAMEATLSGIPAVALSQEVTLDASRKQINWTTAETYAAEVIQKAVSISWPKDILINVNFPSILSNNKNNIEVTREGRRKVGDEVIEKIDPRGEAYFWIGAQQYSGNYPKGTDLAAIKNGIISVTPISLNLTHRASIQPLKEAFKK